MLLVVGAWYLILVMNRNRYGMVPLMTDDYGIVPSSYLRHHHPKNMPSKEFLFRETSEAS